MLRNLILVFIGGGLGSAFRFYTNHLTVGLLPRPFFAGTFIVNIVGSFLIGIFIGLGDRQSVVGQDVILFGATGFCGGFTTFSAFSGEILRLVQSGEYLIALTYISASIIAGIAAAFVGYSIAK